MATRAPRPAPKATPPLVARVATIHAKAKAAGKVRRDPPPRNGQLFHV